MRHFAQALEEFLVAEVVVDAFFAGLSPDPRVLKADRSQGVFRKSFLEFSQSLISKGRMQTGLAKSRDLDALFARAEAELRNLSGTISGPVRIGLMPTFTRGVLAPAISRFIADHPNVDVTVVEAYSAALMERLAEGEADFVVVPQDGGRMGMRRR